MSDPGRELRDLLDSAAGGEPPVRIDLDRVLADGERAVRRRRAAHLTTAAAACVLVVGAAAAVPALHRDTTTRRHVDAAASSSGDSATASPAPSSTRPAVVAPPTPTMPTTYPPTAEDDMLTANRLSAALNAVLPLPKAIVTPVRDQPPLVFRRSDDTYVAEANIRDGDGVGSVRIIVAPLHGSPSDPCVGVPLKCTTPPNVQGDLRLGIADGPGPGDTHQWEVRALRGDGTSVDVLARNWSQPEATSPPPTSGAGTPPPHAERVDSPLTTNQMVKVAVEPALLW